MNSPEARWWSTRAGEYVLGTLRGEDLGLFERILAHDTEMQAEVVRWERRLAPLHETTLPRAPAEHVWSRIVERVRALAENPLEAKSPSADEATGAYDSAARVGTTRVGKAADDAVVPLRPRRDTARAASGGRPSRLWPTVAGLATAASLVLSVLVGGLLYQRANQPDAAPLDVDGLAVVLSDEDGKPYFLVETDYGNLRVRVTALTPPALDEERNFQLWQALPDRSSVRPVALLPTESGRTSVFDVGSLIDGSDLFGVSIEPVDAPTDDGPTGPVVAHGDFLPTADAN